MPERVIIVPKMQRKNDEATSTAFHTFIMPFFSCIMTECRKAVALNQGSSDAFSTGSQAQYPPQPRAAYAQLAPISTPTPWNNQVTRLQRRVVKIHASPFCRVISEPMAKANGTTMPT